MCSFSIHLDELWTTKQTWNLLLWGSQELNLILPPPNIPLYIPSFALKGEVMIGEVSEPRKMNNSYTLKKNPSSNQDFSEFKMSMEICFKSQSALLKGMVFK